MDVLFNPMALPVLASVLMLLVLLSLARHRLPGVIHWMLGCAILIASQYAYATREAASLLFSMVFANAAFLAGMLLLLAGCLRFFDRPAPYRIALIILGGMTLYNLGPWLGYDRIDHRVIAFSLVHGSLCAWLAAIVWQHRPHERACYVYGLCAGIAGLLALGHIVRIVYYAMLPDPALAENLSEGMPGVFLALGVLGNAALIMSLIVMAHDRLLADIEAIAYRDYLTGAASRLSFLRTLSQMLVPMRGTPTFSLLLIDLDHFKRINDAHGHAAGDLALIHFTALTKACLRREDILGRLGGEEFAVLLPEASLADAVDLDERLRRALAQHPARHGQETLHHGFSCGLASAEPGDTPERLMARADAALYRAKHRGRGRLEHADVAPDLSHELGVA